MADTEPTTNPAKRRRWPAGVATIAGVLLLAVIFVWQTRLVMAERVLSWFIADQGLGPASMTVTKLDLNGAQVIDTQTSYGSIREISVTYSLETLLRGRAQRLSVKGADLTIKQKEEKDTTKTSYRSPPRAMDQSFSGVILPIDTVSVRQFQVHLETELGPMAISFDGDLSGVDETSGEMRFVAQTPFGEGSGTAQASLGANSLIDFELVTEATSSHRSAQGRGKITAGGTWDLPANRLELTEGRADIYNLAIGDQISIPGNSILEIDGSETWIALRDGTGAVQLAPFSLAVELVRNGEDPLAMQIGATNLRATMTPQGEDLMVVGGRAELPAYEIAVSSVNGKASRSAIDGGIAIGAKIERVRHTGSPSFITPLMAEIDAHVSSDGINFSAVVKNPDQRLQTKISGLYQPHDESGSAHVNLDPLDLEAGGGIRALFPITESWITSAKGEIGLSGDLRWSLEGQQTDVTVRLDRVAVMGENLGVTDVTASLKFNDVLPPTTAGSQHLIATALLPNMEPIPLELDFQLAPGHMQLVTGKAEVLGGSVHVAEADFDARTSKGSALVSVKNMDLSLVSKLIDLDEFDGTGRLSGQLPVRISGDRVAIDGGRLQTTEPGVIRIGSKVLSDQLGNTGDTVDLTLQALADFHYRELALELDKPLSGEGSIMAHMDGLNPLVLEGHPFVFNIRLSADFDRITQILTEAANIAGKALGWGLNK